MEEIRRLRRERGLSQAKLAALASLDPSTVSQIETGARRANARTLERLAEALGAEVADLFPKVQPPLPEIEDGAEDKGFDSPARSYRLPAPHHLEQRRQHAERMMEAGVSESAVQVVPRTGHRPEEYWRALEKVTGLEGNPHDGQRESRLPEVADDLLAFGHHLLRTWEADLPHRAQADDDEWLGNIVATWLIFGKINYGVLEELAGEGLSDKQGWLEQYMARYMDVNAAIHRLNIAIRAHSVPGVMSGEMALAGLEPLVVK